MNLRINGEPKALDLGEATVRGLLDALRIQSAQVAVELNGAIVKKSEHQTRAIRDGDVLEIVTLVGGG